MKRIKLGAQGEVNFYSVDRLPNDLIPSTERNRRGLPIVGHSENDHHHVIDADVDILEHPNPPAGMKIFYALLEEPTKIIQDAPNAHDAQIIPAGIIEFRISREYDPFAEQARRVSD